MGIARLKVSNCSPSDAHTPDLPSVVSHREWTVVRGRTKATGMGAWLKRPGFPTGERLSDPRIEWPNKEVVALVTLPVRDGALLGSLTRRAVWPRERSSGSLANLVAGPNLVSLPRPVETTKTDLRRETCCTLLLVHIWIFKVPTFVKSGDGHRHLKVMRPGPLKHSRSRPGWSNKQAISNLGQQYSPQGPNPSFEADSVSNESLPSRSLKIP